MASLFTYKKYYTPIALLLIELAALIVCMMVNQGILILGPWISVVTGLIVAFTTIICIKIFGRMHNNMLHDGSKKKGIANFWIQFGYMALLVMLVWSIFTVFNINIKDDKMAMTVAIFTAIIGYIFPDIIKSIVAYFHLNFNNQLHVGDWICVPKHDIDGTVTNISLISITVENWDSTTSSLPTHVLLSEHLKNNQKMLEEKTRGRRVLRTFVIDVATIKSLDKEGVEKIKNILTTLGEDTITLDHTHYPVLNIELYRKYLRHWLMNYDNVVSHEPRLLVNWLDHTSGGLQLQVYVFLTITRREPYEAVQSAIIEHVIQSMEWFGIRLYQHKYSNIPNE